jgi:hypothetical protein
MTAELDDLVEGSGPCRWTAGRTRSRGSTRCPRRSARAGRTVSVRCLIATRVNAVGCREIRRCAKHGPRFEAIDTASTKLVN